METPRPGPNVRLIDQQLEDMRALAADVRELKQVQTDTSRNIANLSLSVGGLNNSLDQWMRLGEGALKVGRIIAITIFICMSALISMLVDLRVNTDGIVIGPRVQPAPVVTTTPDVK